MLLDRLPFRGFDEAFYDVESGVRHDTYADHAKSRFFVENDAEPIYVLEKCFGFPDRMRAVFAAMIAEGACGWIVYFFHDS